MQDPVILIQKPFMMVCIDPDQFFALGIGVWRVNGRVQVGVSVFMLNIEIFF